RRFCIVVLLIPVPTPFPDITVEIVQAKRIGTLLAHRVGTLLAHWVGPVIRIAREPRILSQARLIVPEAEPGRAPCPAGILPLRLRWEPIALPTRSHPPFGSIIGLQTVSRAQHVAECNRVIPGNLVHGQSLEIPKVWSET